MLGYDVEFTPDASDERLIARALETGRVLLTRDIELYRRAVKSGVEALLADGVNQAENLAKLSERFRVRLTFDEAFTRCPLCNAPLTEVDAESIRRRVAQSTLDRYQEFWLCTNPMCKKVYWQGSHWVKIKEILNNSKDYLKRRQVHSG